MGQSPSVPVEHARLLFSSNSLRNTTAECDALGIHYQLSTSTEGLKNERLTIFTRWDPREEKDVIIAKWKRKKFGKDRIRFGSEPQLIVEDGSESDDGFMLLQDFFQRTWGCPGGVRVNRTFTASNGKRYVWKSRHRSLKLYEEGGDVPIASYTKRCCVKKRKPELVLAPGREDILDYIVVTCVIAERKRRDAKTRQRAAIAGGAAAGSAGGG